MLLLQLLSQVLVCISLLLLAAAHPACAMPAAYCKEYISPLHIVCTET
jgi:hypothetical protein